MDKIDIRSELANLLKSHAEQVRKFNLYGRLYPIVNDAGELWESGREGRKARAFIGADLGRITGACLILDLAKEDSIRDVEEVLALIDERCSAYAERHWSRWNWSTCKWESYDSTDLGCRQWTGHMTSKIAGQKYTHLTPVVVRAFVRDSDLCKIVETGEVRPVTKIVCPEEAA